jgi:hypothetical protein
LKVIEVLHAVDRRVPSPAEEWRRGAPPEGKARRQLRFYWAQTANCLARRRVDEAVALVAVLERFVRNDLITAETVVDLHAGMRYGCMLAGTDPARYLLDLDEPLDRFFDVLETRLGNAHFASNAKRRLLDCFLTSVLSDNERLRGLIESYRSSRSYRLGRALTQSARKLGALLGR